MKYTVVIRQPVDVGMRQVLEKQLMERFGLSGDQAQRLSARRAGRLMKPTGRSRAELLMSVFSSVGAEVSLEEVREQTGLLSEPFQGVSQTPHGRSSAPIDVHDDAPLAPLLPPDETPQDLFRAPLASWPQTTQPASRTDQNLDWDTTPLPSGWPDFSGTTPAPGRTPTAPMSSSSPAPAAVLNVPSPVLDDSDFQGPPDRNPKVNLLDTFMDFSSPIPPAASTAPAQSGNTLHTTSLPSADPVPAAPTARAAADPVTTTDVWTDFTGSLTVMDNQTVHDSKTTSVNAISPVLVPAMPDTPEASNPQRRSSLARQLVIGTLTPLVVSSLLTLGVLFLTLPNLAPTTLLLVLAVSLVGLGLAAWLAVRAAKQVTEPIERLVKAADAISMGDLTRPVPVERNDEIGDLSHALERMRLSLEAAMERLRRRQRRDTRFK